MIKFVSKVPQNTSNQIIIRQLIRAGTSIGANIAEGFAGCSTKDFINYYNIALKSANETIYWLKLLRETNSNVSNEVLTLVAETEEITKILAKIIIKCRK